MNNKDSYLPHDYHKSSVNNKAYFNNKTAHLTHYDTKVVQKQNDVGLNFYESNKQFTLPEPLLLDMTFSDVLNNRKSKRDFNKYNITAKEVSTLLNYSLGFNKTRFSKKYVPSSGGFQSVEGFVVILNSIEIPPGIYYYDARINSLKSITYGKFDKWLDNHVFFQTEWSRSSMMVLLASNLGRLTAKYSQRAYRLALMDIGHVSQNLYLGAAAVDLNICASAGYVESEIEDAVNIDGLEIASFLTLSIGK